MLWVADWVADRVAQIPSSSQFSHKKTNSWELHNKGPFTQAIFLLLMHAIKWIDLRMYQTICAKLYKSILLWLNLMSQSLPSVTTPPPPWAFDIFAISCVYTLRLIGRISYPGECDLTVQARKYSVILSQMYFVTFIRIYNMHQDTKSAWLISVCKCTFRGWLHGDLQPGMNFQPGWLD